MSLATATIKTIGEASDAGSRATLHDDLVEHDAPPAPTRAGGPHVEVERMYAEVRSMLFGAAPEAITIGRYEVLDRIGAGGMGFVYVGYDVELARKVAIKLVRPDSGQLDPTRSRERLLREAKAMARVSSPYVVTVYEAGTHDDQVFVAMEFVDGETLTQWLDDRAVSWTTVRQVFMDAARGLQAVHAAGLVHRDFKPDNVLVAPEGRALVADFGLARVGAAGGEGDPAAPAFTDESNTKLTRTGAMAGSIAYMSPEQHRGEPADARSDQFSYCVALFDALHGGRPFPGENAQEIRAAVCDGTIRDATPRGPVPDAVLRALRRGLSVDPEERFADMPALIEALQAADRRWIGWPAVGITAAVVVAMVGLGVAAAAEETDICDDGEAGLADAWGTQRSATLTAALRDSGRPFADQVATQLTTRLDGYAAQWSTAHAISCQQTSSQGRARALLEIACLERSLREMDALVDAIVADPEALAEHATRAAYKLRPIEACQTAPAAELLREAATDPEAARRAAPVLGALDEAHALLLAADHERGIPKAQTVVDEARTLDDAAVVAEALFVLGSLQSLAGRLDEAESNLFEAAVSAEQADNLPVLARARTELTVVVGVRRGDRQQGLRWAALARTALRGTGAGGILEVRLLNAEGLVYRHHGELDPAAQRLQQALALAETALDADHPGLATTHENLGFVLADRGEFAQAGDHMRAALGIRTRTLGAQHPDTRRTRDNVQALEGSR